MSVNNSRSMTVDFHQGSIDNTYIQLTPNRGAVENPPVERLDWPQYRNVEKWCESPHIEGHARRAVLPKEIKTRGGGDLRF